MSFPFIVRQRSFPGRAIVLQGRSLPYQGVSWGGTMRHDITWNPGNPVGVIQVLGPTEKPTRITGKWKDVFLFDLANAPKLVNFPQLQRQATPGSTERGGNTFKSAGSVPGQVAQRARAVRDAFRMLRREGILLKVEWGSIVRFGIISDDDFAHDREEDINFDIEFTWIGDTDSQPEPNVGAGIDIIGLLKELFALLDAIIDELLQAIFAAQQWISQITGPINRLSGFATVLLELLERLASFRVAPGNVIGGLRSNLTAIKLAALEVLAVFREDSASVRGAETGDPAEVSRGNRLQEVLRDRIVRMAAFAAAQETALAKQDANELAGVYVTPSGGTLRDAAQRFYNSTDNWRVIAEFNGFSSSIVPVGTVVRVPKV